MTSALARHDRAVRKHLLVAQSARLRQRLADELHSGWMPLRLIADAVPWLAAVLRLRSSPWSLALLALRWLRQRRKAKALRT
jgi:hypothetical protein